MAQVLFEIAGHEFRAGQLVVSGLMFLALFGIYVGMRRKVLPRVLDGEQMTDLDRRKIYRMLRIMIFVISIIGLIIILEFDYILIPSEDGIDLTLATIFEAILIFQVARLFDWIFSKFLIYNYYKSRREMETDKELLPTDLGEENRAHRVVQYLAYVFAIILILRNFDLDFTLLHFEGYDFRISNIFTALLVIILAQLVSWVLTRLILFNYYRNNATNLGSQFAINQLLRYIIYVIAFFMALESLGIQMTVIWGGAAALLVGVGLGLQQTFNDLISGIILLFERSVEVGSIVEVNGMVGRVKKIGFRTSEVETRDNISVIVPNSKLIVDNVINWSHNDEKVRFIVGIGVAYGSDTQLVKELLLQVARENPYILKFPAPTIRFVNFGDSSLDFELLFWSRNLMIIEDIKSDMRFEIDRLFRENNVEIPFPQRDVHFRTHLVRKDG